MFKYAIVTETFPTEGRVRVEFTEDKIVSRPIPVLVSRTLNDKHFYMPAINEPVVCLMDANCEDGVVLGAIYSDAVKPDQNVDDGTTGIVFDDGTVVAYDKATKTILVKSVDVVNIECENANVKANVQATVDTPSATFTGDVTINGNLSIDGVTNGTGDIVSSGNVQAGADVIAPGGITLLGHKHPTAPMGPPSPPIP